MFLRRLALAALLALSLAPAFALAPPPVPGLPDTERRTSYSLSASTCACSVGFALYGDSTDVDSWIEVWVGGTRYLSSDLTFGWTLTSATGPLATIPRPITDAVLTFNTAQTGTVQIVSARRPRRTSQFSENRGVAARDLNQAITDIVAMLRDDWDKINDVTGRGLFFAPGYTVGPMPTPANCVNSYLSFDATGLNPKCIPSSGSGINIPTVRAGDVPVWTGTQWVVVPGNNIGTQVLTENSSGVATWGPGGGGSSSACIQDFLAGVGFTAGTTTTLTSTCLASTAASISVFFDGVRQSANTWSFVSTSTVNFVAAIPLNVQVVEFQVGVPTGGVVGPNVSVDGQIAAFSGITGGVLKVAPTTGSGNVVEATAPVIDLSQATGCALTTCVTGTLPIANLPISMSGSTTRQFATVIINGAIRSIYCVQLNGLNPSDILMVTGQIAMTNNQSYVAGWAAYLGWSATSCADASSNIINPAQSAAQMDLSLSVGHHGTASRTGMVTGLSGTVYLHIFMFGDSTGGSDALAIEDGGGISVMRIGN